MSRTQENTAYAQRLIKESNHARKLLRKYLKKPHDPSDVTAMIVVVIENMTAKQSKIIGYTLNSAFKAGAKEGDKTIRKVRVTASTATVGFDMSKVADTHLRNITKSNIGHLGKYNNQLSKQLLLEFDTLLADNKLVNTLNKSGWSPSIEAALIKRGTSAEVIALAKGQSTMNKVINTLEHNGIRGGMNPRQVSRLMQPHVSSYFGPKGVIIDNVSKFKKVLKVDADGNYKYAKQAITRPYRATPKTYSNLLARSSMLQAHHEGRYQSLQKTGLVDHYISVSVLDANTCNLCATMHGQRVSHSEGPLYHPSCACDLKPEYKKGSGLEHKNKDPGVYDKQRDQHFWKQHQLAEYNKRMPRGAKLKFHSMLPKDALTAMPNKVAMRTIRYNALGKPAKITPKIIKIKPQVAEKLKEKAKEEAKEEIQEKAKEKVKEKVQKIVKKKVVKKDALKEMKKKDREIADELWRGTAKDGNEYAIIRNGKPRLIGGDSSHVRFKPGDLPKTPHEVHHSHPGWDCPLSPADLAHILSDENNTKMMAASRKHIYCLSRTEKTPTVSDFANLKQKWAKRKDVALKEMLEKVKKGELRMSATDAHRKVLIQLNEDFAREYNFDYIIFPR